jgi:hypothetical protein
MQTLVAIFRVNDFGGEFGIAYIQITSDSVLEVKQ